MTADELSRQLHTDRSADMNRRRGVAALSLTAIGALGVVALYQ
jgi:hypothetical protein